jgi:predicted  nucleic acid-binding Zn-ribbon protein
MSKSKQRILYQCLKCGANITSPWLYAPCPVCGWRGSKPVKQKERKKKKAKLSKKVIKALEEAYPNLNIQNERFRKRYAKTIREFRKAPKKLGDVFNEFSHNRKHIAGDV